jgi:hypothetical protein
MPNAQELAAIATLALGFQEKNQPPTICTTYSGMANHRSFGVSAVTPG